MGIIRFLRNRLYHDPNTRIQLNELQKQLNLIKSDIENIETQNLTNWLRNKTLFSHETGVSTERHCEHEIIVSLTTFGERIHNVHLAIESIMQGSIRPNNIILWLAADEFKDKLLPKTLLLQQERGLEIAFCNDLKSYNKLIHSLKKFPNATIITIDDDVMYEYDLLERLINAHIDNPNAVCACRMHRIRLDDDANPSNYLNWDRCICDNVDSTLNFPTGVGGILYPPRCFNNEVFNETVFMDICPKADDIWFYIMARLNNTPSIWVKNPRPEGYYHPLPDSDTTLSSYNTDPVYRGNDIQLQRVYNHYHLK